MKERAGLIAVCFGILVVLAGCANILSSPKEGETIPPGKGRLTVQVEDGSRTALPSEPFSKYILRFEYDGTEGYIHNDVVWSSETSVDLEPGFWTVYADAYVGETVSGTGSAAVTVSAGADTLVTIRVGPKAGVQGTLKYTVSYPTAGTYGAQTLTVSDVSGNLVDGGSVTITNGAPDSLQLDPGVYFVGVVINDTVRRTGVARTSVVHIYGGKETSLEIEIGEAEFTALVPVRVTADLTAPGGITVDDRVVAIYGDAPIPLDSETVSAATGEVEITLWAPSANANVSVRQEIKLGSVTLNGESKPVTIDPEQSAEADLEDTLYKITLDTGIPAGTVTSAVPAAFPGFSVGVTVTPGDTRMLKNGTLKYHNGSTAAAIGGTDPNYAFDMPGANVTIQAEFHQFVWYVSENGADGTGNGSDAFPYATMDAALSGISAAYADLSWPDKGAPNARAAIIRVSGTVTEAIGDADSMVVIKDMGSNLYDNYPPIVLEGTGTLDAGGVNTNRRVLYVENAVVTLRGDLTLTGGYVSTNGGGVYVASGTFTLQGEGTISGNKAPGTSSAGGGVYVTAGAGDFIMSGGTISGNEAYRNGGGVNFAGTTFTMEGGTISGNKATYKDEYGSSGSNGGGVNFAGTTFTMTGGIISYNTAVGNGGGVCVANGCFDMSGNARVVNNQSLQGGGVRVGSSIFTMSENAAVENNKTIGSYNSGGGVYVYTGTFTMEGGTINGNTAGDTDYAGLGGGVYVSQGDFDMQGGTISGNAATSNAGGVYVEIGIFNMRDGTISGNEATGDGGGVYVGWSSSFTGTFNMSGGIIGGSNTTDANTAVSGGGVYVENGTFNMNLNAAVSGNTATDDGGGVYVAGGSFPLNGNVAISGNKATNGGGVYYDSSEMLELGASSAAAISNNEATGDGGGVYLANGSIEWRGTSVISGNKATDDGGGVYMIGGAFYLNNGTISGNEATSGGGVYVASGTFVKVTDAVIYGDINTPHTSGSDENTAGSGNGHAVYVADGPKKRDLTAGTGVALDSTKAGLLGGWEVFSSTGIQAAIDGLPSTLVLPGGTYDMTAEIGISDTITITTEPGAAAILERNSTFITGNMIKVTGSSDLILQAGTDGSLILDGNGDNVSNVAGSLVRVDSGNLTMNVGVTLRNNKNSGDGGGVYVNSGSFAMDGGTINGNWAGNNGGGVYVAGGTFTKTVNGIIYGDTDTTHAEGDIENTAASGIGHAVYVSATKKRNSTAGMGVELDSTKTGLLGGWEDFTSAGISAAITLLASGETLVLPGGTYDMTAPTVEVNKTITITTEPGAEAILERNSTFTDNMIKVVNVSGTHLTLQAGTDGSLILDGNGDEVTASGSLVKVEYILTMENGATLRNNQTTGDGGGVYVDMYGIFTMNGGTISGNQAGFGGGVYVKEGYGRFTMNGGAISGNQAGSGGGVYVGEGDGSFTKTGGAIYGDTNTIHTPDSNENTAASGNGHAVWVTRGFLKRNSTADSEVDLDSGIIGPSGGWEIFTSDDIRGKINAVLANNSGTITLGMGVYYIDSQIEITDNRDITITTETDAAVILMRDSTFPGDMIKVTGGGLTLQAGTGGSLTLNGDYLSGVTGSLVRVEGGDLTIEDDVTLRGNLTSGSGGGVYFAGTTFAMTGGTIRSNAAAGSGGGVYVSTGGDFQMTGGTISANNAPTGYGGGVYVDLNGTFAKTGSIIYGREAEAASNNASGDGYGHAVYVEDGPKKRDLNAMTGEDLDSRLSALDGGGWD
jgi:hypothetical protein